MAAGTPLTRLTLGAASVADDLGYVALSDLARALGDIAADFRVIGGHMVTVLGARWRLGHELYRETGDVDLGITPIVARNHHVVGRLKDLDYAQVAGNRFARELSDLPVKMKDKQDSPRPEAFIDVLIPAYTTRVSELCGEGVAGPGVAGDLSGWGLAWRYGGKSGGEELAAEPGEHVGGAGLGLGGVPRA